MNSVGIGPLRLHVERAPREHAPSAWGRTALGLGLAAGLVFAAAAPASAGGGGVSGTVTVEQPPPPPPPPVYSVTIGLQSDPMATTFRYGACTGGFLPDGTACTVDATLVIPGGHVDSPDIRVTNTGDAGHITRSATALVPDSASQNPTSWQLGTVPAQDVFTLADVNGTLPAQQAISSTPAPDQHFGVPDGSADHGIAVIERFRLTAPTASTDPALVWHNSITWTAGA